MHFTLAFEMRFRSDLRPHNTTENTSHDPSFWAVYTEMQAQSFQTKTRSEALSKVKNAGVV